MSTSLASAAAPAARVSPNVRQGSWSGSPVVQSPNIPPHGSHGGVSADAPPFLASQTVLPAEGQSKRQLAGVHPPAPTTLSLQNVSSTHPPGPQPNLPQPGQRHPSQESNTLQPQSQGHSNLIRSDTGPAMKQHAFDKSHTDQYATIANTIKSADRSVLRQVIRDHWDLCLMGSDYNLAFFLNAILHQAPPDVLRRSVQDFGGQLVGAALPQIVNRCSAADLDHVSDLVLPKLSPHFLDRALARRLETIDARSLVNALARAERLGYDVSDIVVERSPDKPEQVVPSLQGIMPADFVLSNQSSASLAERQTLQDHRRAHTSTRSLIKPHQPNWMAGLPPVPMQGPGGFWYCKDCRRPCSGEEALQYHMKKRACDPFFRLDRLGRNLCTHCGHGFSSGTGLLYHTKVGVCGQYSGDTNKAITAELQRYVNEREARLVMMRAAREQAPTETPPQNQYPAVKSQVVRQVAEQHHASPSPTAPDSRKDDAAYAHLNPDALKRFQAELAKAEEKYGKLMREALVLPEPERTKEMSKWKNCYNTKVSMTRKKYGIRLREKRTQEEMDAERRRLLGQKGPEQWLDMERSAKRSRTDGAGPSSEAASPLPSSRSTPQPSQVLSPKKRMPLADIGGLSGSVGSAETTDPTTLLTSSEPRGLAHLQQSQAQAQIVGSHVTYSRSKPDEPMIIDEDSSSRDSPAATGGRSHSDESTDSDGSGEDIPAL